MVWSIGWHGRYSRCFILLSSQSSLIWFTSSWACDNNQVCSLTTVWTALPRAGEMEAELFFSLRAIGESVRANPFLAFLVSDNLQSMIETFAELCQIHDNKLKSSIFFFKKP